MPERNEQPDEELNENAAAQPAPEIKAKDVAQATVEGFAPESPEEAPEEEP